MDERTLTLAEAHTANEIANGINRVIAQLPVQPPGFNGCCTHCKEVIPQERIKFGAVTCVVCQEAIELRAKMRRKR